MTGSFDYYPDIGSVLWAGESQTLWVVFTPDDSTDYTCAYATVTINVNPATLTVTADNQTMVHGGLVPTLTYTITGYQNGDDFWSADVTGAPVLSTDATSGCTPNGNPYTISCAVGTLAAPDYIFTAADGQLTVTPAPLTITATQFPPPNANGWNNSEVNVSFQASDEASGVSVVTVRVYGSDNVQEFYNDSNESPFTVYWTLTSEGAYQTVIATATSNAGHTATAQVTVSIDWTPPVVIPPHYDGSSAGSEAGDNWHFQATTTGGAWVCYWPIFRYDNDPGMALTEGPIISDALSGIDYSQCGYPPCQNLPMQPVTYIQGEPYVLEGPYEFPIGGNFIMPIGGRIYDMAGNWSEVTWTVTVDRGESLLPPDDVIAEATCPGGAYVQFSPASAMRPGTINYYDQYGRFVGSTSTTWDPLQPVTTSYDPPSGPLLPAGHHHCDSDSRLHRWRLSSKRKRHFLRGCPGHHAARNHAPSGHNPRGQQARRR